MTFGESSRGTSNYQTSQSPRERSDQLLKYGQDRRLVDRVLVPCYACSVGMYNVSRSCLVESRIVRQVKVSAKGWVVIPAALRRRYGLTPGTIVNIEDAGGKIVISPKEEASYKRARGMLPAEPSLTAELLAERARDREREEARIRS